jgi:hypothetical protein
MEACPNEAFHHFLCSIIGPPVGLVPQCPQDHFRISGIHATGLEQSGQPKNVTFPIFIGPESTGFMHLLQYQPLNCGWNQTGSPQTEQAWYSAPLPALRLRRRRTTP